MSCIEQTLQATSHKTSLKPTKLDEYAMRDTAGEVKTNSYAIYYSGPLPTDEHGLGDQREPINNSSVLIQNVA